MYSIQTITVGICAKNEEAIIKYCLGAVCIALRNLAHRRVQVVVNTNSSTDATLSIAQMFAERYDFFHVISSGKNLVDAQRAIVKGFPADTFVFIDADIIIDKTAIQKLILALEENSKIIATYATYIPHTVKKSTWLRTVNAVYDTQKQLQTKRFYLHGRVFATRDWYFPSTKSMRLRIQNSSSKILSNLPEKNQVLIADDIFLSSYLLHKYGIGAIKQITKAKVYYEPVHTLRDFYRGYRRRNLEMLKLTILYPEYNYLLPYLNRKVNWKGFFFKTDFPSQIIWLYFLVQRFVFSHILKLEIVLIVFRLRNSFEQWVPTQSSKLIMHKKIGASFEN